MVKTMSEEKNKPAAKGIEMLAGSLIITRPYYNIALMVFALAGVIAIVWALWGTIPQKIEGLGEFSIDSDVSKITSDYTGQIGALKVKSLDYVKQGDLVAVMSQVDMASRIEEMKKNIQNLVKKKVDLKAGNIVSVDLKFTVLTLAKRRLKEQLEEALKVISYLETRAAQDKKLHEQGLITYSKYFETLSSQSDAKKNKAAIEEEDRTLTLNDQIWKHGLKMSESDIENEIILQSKQLADLEATYLLSTEIRSNVSGKVMHVEVAAGDVIKRGQNLLTLEMPANQTDSYIVRAYIPYNTNTPVANGMKVDIEPFSVDRNLYGWMVGEVINVNYYIASSASLTANLQNDDLAKLITGKGPVYHVTIKVMRDPSTTSGFAWTSKNGPPFKIANGAVTKAYVRVREKAPIDFLMPIFQTYFN